MRRIPALLAAVALAVAALTTGPAVAQARTACTVSADTDNEPNACGPYTYPASRGISGNIEVDNGVWSDPAGFTNQTCTAVRRPCQTLSTISPGHWHVTANWAAGATSVRAYPATDQMVDWVNGKEPKLTTWKSITSSFRETFTRHTNKGTVAEAAYDIFLNNWGNEVMIQTDFAGDSLRPRCDAAGDVAATVAFGGHAGVPRVRWNLCQFDTELIWQLPTGQNMTTGRVDVLAMLTWLETHGHGRYLPARSGLTGIGYGFEICSTGSQPENFTLTRFTLTATR